MKLRQHGHLKGKARRKRSKRDKIFILSDQSLSSLQLLLEHVAVYAALLQSKVVTSDHEFRLNCTRRYWQGHQLRDRMTNGVRTGSLTVVLEDQHVAHTLIALKIEDASYVGSDDVRDFLDFQLVQATVVSRCLRNDLVRPHPVHQIVQRFGTSSQVAFYPQPRAGIRHHPYRPSRPVRRRARISDGEDFRRRRGLVALAEWAEACVPCEFLEVKVPRLQPGPLLHYDPAVSEDVLAHLGHRTLPLRSRKHPRIARHATRRNFQGAGSIVLCLLNRRTSSRGMNCL